MGKWETTPEGTRVYTYNPTKVAYKIMLLLKQKKFLMAKWRIFLESFRVF